MQVEMNRQQEVANKAKSTWDRFRKERDFHKMHHKRVVQVALTLSPSHPLTLTLTRIPEFTRCTTRARVACRRRTS